MDAKNIEVTQSFSDDSIGISGGICPAVEQKDDKESYQAVSRKTKNNEKSSFIRVSMEKGKYSSISGETFNNEHSKPPDSLYLSSIFNNSTDKVILEKCEQLKNSPDKFELDSKSESDFFGRCKRSSSATRFISRQHNDGANVSSSALAASGEEFEITVEEKKGYSFKNYNTISCESLEIAVKKAKYTSKHLNSHLATDFLPEKKASDEVPRETSGENITADPVCQVSGKNDEMSADFPENLDTSVDENDLAGPSGIQPHSIKQERVERFTCRLCHMEFAESLEFDIHYRTHTVDKTFVCEICKTKYTQKGSLEMHYRTHTGEKPFVCEVCQIGFSQKGDLKKHYRTHTGEKPFVCEVCQIGFSRKGNLKRHYRTHTGEKLVVCEVCKKCFADNINLFKHVRTHTSKNP